IEGTTVATERCALQKAITSAADFVSIWVTPKANNARPSVQQPVVRLILANHQIGVAIVALHFINVMDLSMSWEWPTECFFGHYDVLHDVAVNSARMIRHTKFDITVWP